MAHCKLREIGVKTIFWYFTCRFTHFCSLIYFHCFVWIFRTRVYDFSFLNATSHSSIHSNTMEPLLYIKAHIPLSRIGNGDVMSNINHNMPSWSEYEETWEQRGWSGPQDLKGRPGKFFMQGRQYLNRDPKEQNIYQGVKIGKNILGGGNTHGSVSAIRNYQKVGSLSHTKWFIML